MPELSQVDRQLLEAVSRMEMVCLFEAVQPYKLAHFASRSEALVEPSNAQCIQVARVAAITLGRLSSDVDETCAIIEAFAKGQHQGLSVLSSKVSPNDATRLIGHARQFLEMLSFEATGGSTSLDETSRAMLQNAPPSAAELRLITCAFAAAFGSFVKMRGWTGVDATYIVRSTFEGVRAGEAAHDKGT